MTKIFLSHILFINIFMIITFTKIKVIIKTKIELKGKEIHHNIWLDNRIELKKNLLKLLWGSKAELIEKTNVIWRE